MTETEHETNGTNDLSGAYEQEKQTSQSRSTQANNSAKKKKSKFVQRMIEKLEKQATQEHDPLAEKILEVGDKANESYRGFKTSVGNWLRKKTTELAMSMPNAHKQIVPQYSSLVSILEEELSCPQGTKEYQKNLEQGVMIKVKKTTEKGFMGFGNKFSGTGNTNLSVSTLKAIEDDVNVYAFSFDVNLKLSYSKKAGLEDYIPKLVVGVVDVAIKDIAHTLHDELKNTTSYNAINELVFELPKTQGLGNKNVQTTKEQEQTEQRIAYTKKVVLNEQGVNITYIPIDANLPVLSYKTSTLKKEE